MNTQHFLIFAITINAILSKDNQHHHRNIYSYSYFTQKRVYVQNWEKKDQTVLQPFLCKTEVLHLYKQVELQDLQHLRICELYSVRSSSKIAGKNKV